MLAGMDRKSPRPSPALTPRAEAERQARLARQAEALRSNLRKRKAQSRARAATEPAAPDAPLAGQESARDEPQE